MRRPAPRRIANALGGLTRSTTPATLLARVQGSWADAVGPAIAAEAEPVAERSGTLVVTCRSATWANELELLGPTIIEKLNRALGGPPDEPLKELRAKVGSDA